MIYLLIFLSSLIYIYINERKLDRVSFVKFFFILSPVFIFYWVPLAFQKGVGTDYYEYYNYFYNNYHYQYFEKKEYLYYYLVEFTKFIGVPQFQFISISFIQSILFFIILYKIKKYGYVLWIFFIIFFLVTTIYNNQMNGLRQYVVVMCLPIIVMLLHEKKYIKFIICSFFAANFHISVIPVIFFIIFVNYLSKIVSNKLIVVFFVISPLFYLFDFSEIIFNFMDNNNIFYSNYKDSDYNDVSNFSDMALKLVPLPFFALFCFKYWHEYESNLLFKKFLIIWSLTFFMFLMNMHLGMAGRFYIYFTFFTVFPIYYLFVKNKTMALIFLIYYFIFYSAKVLFFAKNEYLYFFNGVWL